MGIKDEFTINEIPLDVAKPFILKKHYAETMPSISYCYGLHREGDLEGVCTFGTPPSPTLRQGVCGEEFSDRVLELNRLVTKDSLPKNACSYFVSRSLKLLPRPSIIVSYADKSKGHHGYIYQATNFIFTGLSAKRTNWSVEGKEHLHATTIHDEFRGEKNRAKKMREKYGDDFELEKRPRKYRYIYFVGSTKEKREMRDNLNYEEEPYPKGDNKKHKEEVKVDTQKSLI